MSGIIETCRDRIRATGIARVEPWQAVLYLALFAMPFTLATSWRLPELPFGAPDLVLMFCAAFFLLASLYRCRLVWLRNYNAMVAFFMVFLTMTIVSTIMHLDINPFFEWGKIDLGVMLRDIAAYLFNGFIVAGLVLGFSLDVARSRYLRDDRRLRSVLFVLLLSSTLFFIVSFLSGSGGSRFSGVSRNPNQLALLSAFLPFLAVYGVLSGKQLAVRLVGAVALFCSIAIALKAQSDAVYVGWAAGTGLCIAVVFARMLWSWAVGNRIKQAVLVSGAVLGLLLMTFASVLVLDRLGEVARRGDADVRIQAWQSGIRSTYEIAPLTGVGAGLRVKLVETPHRYLSTHNVFLEIWIASGLAGIFLFSWLGLTLILRLLRQPYAGVLLGVLCSICVFAVFHNVLRQPVFWLIFTLLISVTGYYQPKPRRDL